MNKEIQRSVCETVVGLCLSGLIVAVLFGAVTYLASTPIIGMIGWFM